MFHFGDRPGRSRIVRPTAWVEEPALGALTPLLRAQPRSESTRDCHEVTEFADSALSSVFLQSRRGSDAAAWSTTTPPRCEALSLRATSGLTIGSSTLATRELIGCPARSAVGLE